MHFLLFIALRDETRVKFNKKKENKAVSHFCLWMKMFGYKIKKLTTYSRDDNFGIS